MGRSRADFQQQGVELQPQTMWSDSRTPLSLVTDIQAVGVQCCSLSPTLFRKFSLYQGFVIHIESSSLAKLALMVPARPGHPLSHTATRRIYPPFCAIPRRGGKYAHPFGCFLVQDDLGRAPNDIITPCCSDNQRPTRSAKQALVKHWSAFWLDPNQLILWHLGGGLCPSGQTVVLALNMDPSTRFTA